MMTAKINQQVPLLAVSEWVQGEPINFDQLVGQVVLVEVFQVNCPGCFLNALPQAIELHERFGNQGLTVLGVATAFEDFDKNNLDNLIRLVNDAEVVGETRQMLSVKGLLSNDRLPYRIPFAIGMDRLHKRQHEVTDEEVMAFILERLPHFDEQSSHYQQRLRAQVTTYLQKLDYHAETFERFGLNGTPSQILVDKRGILREVGFGAFPKLEQRVQMLLDEE